MGVKLEGHEWRRELVKEQLEEQEKEVLDGRYGFYF